MSVTVLCTETTSEVAAERASPFPNRFVAVTPTRSVCPTSAEVTTYVCPLPPATWAQAFPFASQRCQVKTNVIGRAPVHEPVDAVSVCPSCAAPEIVGGDVFTGAAVAITAVCTEVAVAVPDVFEAVRPLRIVEPPLPLERGDGHPQRVAHVCGGQAIALGCRGDDRRAPRATLIATQPLVREPDRRRPRPGARARGQQMALDGLPRDRRRRRVARRRPRRERRRRSQAGHRQDGDEHGDARRTPPGEGTKWTAEHLDHTSSPRWQAHARGSVSGV